MKLVAVLLQAIHAQEDRQAAIAKSRDVISRRLRIKLTKAAKKVEDSVIGTLVYVFFTGTLEEDSQ